MPNEQNAEDALQIKFVSEAAHKLKGPLTTINLYTEALLSGSVGQLSAEQKEYIQEVHDASRKMVTHLKTLRKKLNIPSK